MRSIAASMPYVYFDNTPGDGSDFGFWIDREGINENLFDTIAICKESDDLRNKDNTLKAYMQEYDYAIIRLGTEDVKALYSVDFDNDTLTVIWSI